MASANLGTIINHPVVFGVRRLFYLVGTNETSFETTEQVPDYVTKALPYFFSLAVLEAIIAPLRGKRRFRINDGITSISAGLISLLPLILWRGIDTSLYMIMYDMRLMSLQWDHPFTWWIAFIGVDFAYYWVHRMGHEVNLFWATHQAHHSSEDYNFTTALRQSTFQKFYAMFFYLPMAIVGVPPSLYLVHAHFNLLYQFWIHTEIVGKLGPLEYILNTPSLHRVHHGRNRYCIDKNYGGTLIIWDLLFGTYASETDEVVYGLVHPLGTFDSIHVQLCHFKWIWSQFWKMDGLKNKLSVILKGPGWEPGKPRLGYKDDIPDISAPQPRYDPQLPTWCGVYILLHTGLLVFGYLWLLNISEILQQVLVIAGVLYILLALSTFGWICDHRTFAPIVELQRCLFTIAVYLLCRCRGYVPPVAIVFELANVFFIFSAVLWSIQSYKQFFNTSKSTKTQ
ncbi:alkylglycerol monooxygenase-like [Tubulanus polymorphus]|uniref:alkylglycerol monooxygenase-like n=1 Tax=Tubulanus polymorphus TaxID=672921 RepID=UPI003DA6B695